MTFEKYPKIYALGHKQNEISILDDPEASIEIEEKIDGACFRFMIHDGKLIFGSRNKQLSVEDSGSKAWKRCTQHIIQQIGNSPEAKTISKYPNRWNGFIFYGECCIRHTIPYDWDKIPPFLGFDIRQPNGDWSTVPKGIFELFGLGFVPQITKVKAKMITPQMFENDDIVPQSQYYDGQAEGVVFKDRKNGIIEKYVREKFKEANRSTFGQSPKFAKDDSERLVAKYCTNARIDKMIFSYLTEEGQKLELKMMKSLPIDILKDIYIEHGMEILMSKTKLDLFMIRKLIAKRCLAVLKQMITNQAFV